MSLEFQALLLDISNQLSVDQLDQLKFLLKDQVGKRDRERLRSGRELFMLLTERGLLSADRTDYLSELLSRIHRHDLCQRLGDPHGGPHSGPPGPEEAKLEIAIEVISQNLGRTWRKLGRRLGVSEVKLESIAGRHPTELEETAVELLKEWRRSKGAAAQSEELVQALRACHCNMTADKVEDRLSASGD